MDGKLYIFMGEGARFPSGTFTTLENAEQWIRKHSLSGVLGQYPVDEGLYDWAIEENLFTIKNEHQKEAGFIQRFTCAAIDHFHFENGEQV